MFVFIDGQSYDFPIINNLDFNNKIHDEIIIIPIVKNDNNKEMYESICLNFSEVLKSQNKILYNSEIEIINVNLEIVYSNIFINEFQIGADIYHRDIESNEYNNDFIFAENSWCKENEIKWLKEKLQII